MFAHNLEGGGGSVVGANLVRALPAARPDIDFLMVVPRTENYRWSSDHRSADVLAVNPMTFRSQFTWPFVQGPRIASEFAADWVVSLGNVPIAARGRRSAVLVHDPNVFYPWNVVRVQDAPTRLKKRLLRAYLRRALPQVDVVFAQTDVAVTRLRSMYSIRECVTLPNVVSTLISNANPPDNGFGVPVGFRFLTLTRYYPHKNLESLVMAYELLLKRLPSAVGILTIDPSDHRRAPALLASIEDRGLSGSVVNIGPVGQSALGALYSGVDAVVLPTLLESSSGAYVEALTFGLPIITSDRDFAREVCGDAAIYVDPDDPAAIAQGMWAVASDHELRSGASRAGHERLATMRADWESVAARLVATIESAG